MFKNFGGIFDESSLSVWPEVESKLCVFIYMILGGKRGSNDVKIFLGAIFYISLISTLIYILQEGEFET